MGIRAISTPEGIEVDEAAIIAKGKTICAQLKPDFDRELNVVYLPESIRGAKLRDLPNYDSDLTAGEFISRISFEDFIAMMKNHGDGYGFYTFDGLTVIPAFKDGEEGWIYMAKGYFGEVK